MRNKKLLSTVVTSALVATTMAVPVIAADGGSVDVEFTTKTPVIRVAVPTSIIAAVDPLEMNTSGTQIHSTDFTITNMSEVPVGIDVKSQVDLGTGVTLVGTKEEAASSTDKTKSEAWVAVAAQVASGKYAEDSKTAGDLTEADKNVKTFTTDSSATPAESSAGQTFYLDKAASGTTTYKIAAPVATATAGKKTPAEYKELLTYAQVYKLTEETTIDSEDKLLAKLKTSDVYEGDNSNDGTALTLIPAGTTNVTYTSGKSYFTAADTNSLENMLASEIYVYGEGGTGASTAFRYIGKLGQGKASWSDADIQEMHITYSIQGLTDDAYTAADVGGSYGLYEANVAPSMASTCNYTPGQPAEVAVNLGAGELAATGISSVTFMNNGSNVTLPAERWSYSNGKLTFIGAYTTMLNTISREHTVVFNDTAKTKLKVMVQPEPATP